MVTVPTKTVGYPNGNTPTGNTAVALLALRHLQQWVAQQRELIRSHEIEDALELRLDPYLDFAQQRRDHARRTDNLHEVLEHLDTELLAIPAYLHPLDMQQQKKALVGPFTALLLLRYNLVALRSLGGSAAVRLAVLDIWDACAPTSIYPYARPPCRVLECFVEEFLNDI